LKNFFDPNIKYNFFKNRDRVKKKKANYRRLGVINPFFYIYNNFIFFYVKLIYHSLLKQYKTSRKYEKSNPKRMKKYRIKTKKLLRTKMNETKVR
jgi:hypothetical protein